jgi:hypothetical protein
MNREKALKGVLIVVGLFFIAGVYPLIQMRESEVLQMMLSVYVTLGVFLVLASRDPAAHRSLIAFRAWSSFAHAATMAVQSVHNVGDRVHLLTGTLLLVIIGIPLIMLAPPKLRVAQS